MWPFTFTPVLIVIPFFLKLSHDDVRDVGVEAGKDLGETLEDRDLGAEVGERRCELAADRAAADDGDAGGHVVEIEDLVARHDRTATVEAGDRAWHRAGGEDHVGAGDRRGAAVVHRDGDGRGRRRANRRR